MSGGGRRDGEYGCETPSAAAVALPFVIALAADPATGARIDLVELLAAMHAPALAGEDWSGAWALLADPEPTVRRAATALPVGIALLLERWRAEPDPTVRLPLLLALGEAAASGEAGEAGEHADDARAVLAALLDGDDPVLWVAAVHASAELDRELPVRQVDRLIEVFSDLALRPRFESVWHTPDVEIPWTREDLVRSTAWLLRHDPEAELSFAMRLVETAQRSGDAALCREALDVAWRLLTERRSVEAALLPLAGGLLTDPDGAVRLRAANILAVLGPAAAPYADRLADLLEDEASDLYLDGTVRDISRWALTRIGDPRALPGLVERLRAQEEEQGRGFVIGDPRRPNTEDVLMPLRAHADILLPAIRETIRQCGARGGATRSFLPVLEAWGEDALPALPDLIPLLADTWTSVDVLRVLRVMGPALPRPYPRCVPARFWTPRPITAPWTGLPPVSARTAPKFCASPARGSWRRKNPGMGRSATCPSSAGTRRPTRTGCGSRWRARRIGHGSPRRSRSGRSRAGSNRACGFWRSSSCRSPTAVTASGSSATPSGP
nr:HEAT repeat domain-containing protein [Streptomyces sp. NBC_00998]